MAQLIKLKDYISRYEWNMYRYPSQFLRMKQENWRKLYALWDQPAESRVNEQSTDQDISPFSKWKALLKRNPVESEIQEQSLPSSETELKHYFLDKLFPIQLKWASSTVTDVSFMQSDYNEDKLLKYFLHRFPDTYFVMYYPILTVQKASVDGEIILISPVGIEIIYVLEADSQAIIHFTNDRTWHIQANQQQESILSPLLALKRTAHIIKSILLKEEIDFPVRKVVLSRTNFINVKTEPYNVQLVDKKYYSQWFSKKRHFVSPLKNRQLKAANALLKYCQTTSVKRPEWEDDSSIFTMDERR
ncbi:NERD domain-containing protein [Lentibacillus sp. N15]|uniref:NERD domain-containing protein n=1 Tax=Lentibacillus songyuanensis TaxID=3136161 RepID=UPI0031B9F2A3